MTEVRRATRADIGAVLALWAKDAYGRSISDDGEAVAALLRRDAHALLIATEADEVVGTVIVGWDGWRCSLYRLAVRAGVRRQGVATALIEAAESRARRHGARRIDAMVDHGNDEGSAFWSAAGFVANDNYTRWEFSLES